MDLWNFTKIIVTFIQIKAFWLECTTFHLQENNSFSSIEITLIQSPFPDLYLDLRQFFAISAHFHQILAYLAYLFHLF